VAQPRDLVEQIEQSPSLPPGAQERFNGYGVMSAPFAGGYNLCLRRFPASSVGPAYISVWCRDPEGNWTFFQNAPPAQACPRYFSSALARILVRDIEIAWTGPRAFSVTISGGDELRWDLTLAETLPTRLMNVMSALVPERLWHEPAFLRVMGGVARVTLGTGKLTLAGQAPNGQTFVANPRLVWLISSSQAVLNGVDLGQMERAGPQTKLGDFWIPQRGLFAIGRAFFEPFDPAHHLPLPTESAP
jgi:hypothetical protein